MDYYEYNFNATDLPTGKWEIGRWMGYPEKGIPPAIEEQIDEVLSILISLLDAKGGFGISDNISFRSASLLIENLEFKTKKIISSSLNKATSMAIFACTIGEEASSWATLHIKDEPLKGYIADVAASILAEKVAEKIHEKIEQFAQKQSELISNRYSPGYCGWSVSDQHLLFSFLTENFCGINLNNAALMHPIKSVSGIVGIGENMVKDPYLCNQCEITDCIMSTLK